MSHTQITVQPFDGPIDFNVNCEDHKEGYEAYEGYEEDYEDYEDGEGDEDDEENMPVVSADLENEYALKAAEETRLRIEFWKTYRGAITKLKIENNHTEQFLKTYRANFTGKANSHEDETLLDMLDRGGELSEMSLWLLERLGEDFEDAEEDVEYFQALRQKILTFV